MEAAMVGLRKWTSKAVAGVAARAMLASALMLTGAAINPAWAQTAPRQLVTGTAQADAQPTTDPLVVRQRGVQLDLGTLGRAMGDAGRKIEVAFFTDATFEIELTASHATHSGGSSFSGRVVNAPMSQVVMIDNGNAITMLAVINGRRYELHGTPTGGYVSREMAAHARPEHPELEPDPSLIAAPASEGNPDHPVFAPPTGQADDGFTIDVMVVYTPNARNSNGGTAQMQANIDAQVALTNTIYANSNVVQRIRLVYRGEVAYSENNLSLDLLRLASLNDGFMDQVPILRDAYRADIVSLWGQYTGNCGVGYLTTPESAANAPTAYNVVASPACTGAGSYSYAHELGHNMGLRHDPFVDAGATAVTPEAGGPVTSIGYAHGYVDLANRFYTVMAYVNKCAASSVSCLSIPYFSNPALTYDNSGFYPSAVVAPLGNSGNGNERQALNDTRETVANFRQGLLNLTGPGAVLFMRPRYSVNEAGGSVQLTVGRHVGSTGAISVAYTTQNGNTVGGAVAGADFTATSGTLSWADGDVAEKTITIPILVDTLLEGPETFNVVLSSATGGASVGGVGGTTSSVSVTINDDDPDVFPLGMAIPGGYDTPAGSGGAWTVDTTTGYLSTASLRSHNILGPSSAQNVYANSDLAYTANFTAGTIAFAFKISSFLAYGQFDFLIDDVVMFNNQGGEVNWSTVSIPVTAGNHTLRWRYKNRLNIICSNTIAGSQCQDRLWVDNIVMPVAPAVSIVALSSSANPVATGQPVTFTASVSSGAGNPVGVVTFADGASDITGCIGLTMQSGSAQCTTNALAAGTHSITARYSGSVNHGAGVSTILTQQVNAPDAKAARRSDIDGDGKGDILWHNAGTGMVYALQMNGFATSNSAVVATRADLNWKVAAIADLNGDGKADIVWHHATTGAVEGSLLNGALVQSTGTIYIEPDTNWKIAGAADFNGDGKADLLWRNAATGDVYMQILNGSTPTSGAVIYSEPNSAWQIQQLADFNGDGKADILWRNASTGEGFLQLMNGTSVIGGGVIFAVATEWKIQEAADFDGDGKADILWRNAATGDVYLMLMNGTSIAGGSVFYNETDANWKIVAAGDYDGDGKADILWRHAVTGRVFMMTMNGTTVTSSGFVYAESDLGWRILP